MKPLPPAMQDALASQSIVYVFGAGISSSLTGRNYGWWTWIVDGIHHIKDSSLAKKLEEDITTDSSTDNLIRVVGRAIEQTKKDGTYDAWMQGGFESSEVKNGELVKSLQLLNLPQDILVTTNYDSYLEAALGMSLYTKDDAGQIFRMMQSGICSSVVHIHGAYSSKLHIDNIVATKEQYDELYSDEGAQFIQNLLGTRPLVFIGCGQTTDDKNIAHFIRFACEHLQLEVPYYYLKRTGDTAPELPDHFQIVNYGEEFGDLVGFLREMALYRSQKLAEQTPIIGRTTRSIANSSEYHYSSEKLAFVGRRTELHALNTFLNDSRRVLWWAITGQGGSGKSRLAYELLKENDKNWFGFFWNDKATIQDAEGFRPFCNTIIVIDYVKGRENNVAEWMHILIGKFKPTDFCLRIILIERESNQDAGSWYSTLEDEWGGFDSEAFKRNAFSNDFLYLGDLDDDSVSKLIGEVRANNGLPVDRWQDNRLRDDYRKKFEKLKFRPLFVQLYVEAWIANKCTEPDYDSLEEVVKSSLLREQKRWEEFFDGRLDVVRSFIRLLVRAAAGGELSDSNIPDIYKEDWKKLRDYFKSLTLPGRQAKESYRNFLSDLTQNFEQEGFSLKTYYPDIINEYMFAFYADDDIKDVVNELKENCGQHFAIFMQRAETDFSGNEVINRVITESTGDTTNPELLIARLERLKKSVVKPGETMESRKAEVDTEYDFWHLLPYVEDAEKEQSNESFIAIAKLAGFHGCAMQYGALMFLDEMDKCMDEMLSMKGEVLDLIKTVFLEERMNTCSRAGYSELAQKYEAERRKILNNTEEKDSALEEYSGLASLQEANNRMMDCLIGGDVYGAKEVLNKEYKRLDFTAENSEKYVKDFSDMVTRYAMFQMQFGEIKYADYIETFINRCREAFPNNSDIASSFYITKGFLIQGELIKYDRNSKVNDNTKKALINKAIQLLRDAEACNVPSETWGVVAAVPVGWMTLDYEDEIQRIISAAEKRLSNELSVETAKAWMICQRRLYELKGQIVPKEVADQGFAYYLRDPSSETTRDIFFNLLDASTEKDHKSQYILPQVKDSMMQDAMFNPIYYRDALGQLMDVIQEPEFLGKYMNAGNDSLDYPEFDPFEEQKPYVRPGKKIGRNDPCPCGSGKKYKNCCGRKK